MVKHALSNKNNRNNIMSKTRSDNRDKPELAGLAEFLINVQIDKLKIQCYELAMKRKAAKENNTMSQDSINDYEVV